MAESGSGQEKTEDPTGKKIEEARDEGQVPRSRELTTLLMLFTAGGGFLFMGKDIIEDLLMILRSNLSIERSLLFQESALAQRLWDSINSGLLALLPFFVLMVVGALASPIILGGWSFSTKALMPKLSKLDPIKGMARLLSSKGLVELIKALLKFVLVTIVGYFLFQSYISDFLLLGNMQVGDGIGTLGSDLLWVFVLLSCSLIVVALIDIPFQLYDYNKQQKMTKQEVKDENKETEGNPELKRKVKQAQFDLTQRRMMEAIPDADVVITNPTHYAVALKYDQINMSAPIVVGLGADLIALQIRRIASAHDVPILESPVLARSIYHNSKIGQEIPAGLYHAVAQVLAYIYQLKQYQQNGGVEPSPVTDIPIPDELKRDD